MNPRYIFNSIYFNKIEVLQSELLRHPELILDTDAVGATAIHVAYLYERYDIGRWMVEHFPDEALKAYSVESTFEYLPAEYMPYVGQNILHLTIMRRNHAEARWILDFFRDRWAVQTIVISITLLRMH